jgi:very-short-patch-repair endonuclease
MKRKYICKFCGIESKCQYAHEKHLKTTHADVAYKCAKCKSLFYDLKGLMNHLTRAHALRHEAYWQEHIYTNDDICPKSKDTNENLTYTEYTQNHGYKIRSNFYHSNKDIQVNFTCEVCGVGFEKINHLAKHLTDSHPEVDKEKYYKKYFWKKGDPSGKCLECDKKLKFIGLKDGYQKFCYNTDCNVNYHNKHKDRHLCGENISKGQKRTQNMPNQIGYWVKKGYTEEQAKALVTERQTTNSLDKIMKREGCDLKDAKKIRKGITKKWMDSLPKQNYSNKSQVLFWELYKCLHHKYKQIHFATNDNGEVVDNKNKEYKVQTKNTFRMLDFYIPEINKVIEFDGTYWHGRVGRGNKTKDAMRDLEIQEAIGAKIMHIPEKDFDKNKEEVIQKCQEFLNE